ncbi:MAG: DNA methyltransferase [Acidimicrobiaceae bacterium]|nr:DNA methyltransferase [Acidimicrobiaceae bacterium]
MRRLPFVQSEIGQVSSNLNTLKKNASESIPKKTIQWKKRPQQENTCQTNSPKEDTRGSMWSVFRGDALDAYSHWPTPSVIISDGAYGVGGFPGDPRTTNDLADWYEPHVESWSRHAQAASTLWFWNTELGWATVHPVLIRHGWEYVQTIVWDKGVAHIAGNVNSDTIRQFPVVTEVCVFYRRRLEFNTPSGAMSAKQWLRYEWQRTGLPLNRANAACGVANAATRKYLTQDWLWYLPPPEMMQRLVAYANEHGRPDGRPYYSLDGTVPATLSDWAQLRGTWSHSHGITNVWSVPPLNGGERYKGNGVRSAPRVHRPGRNAAVHLNQKPLEFMRRIISAATVPGDMVWEPFGGLCSALVAAVELGRDGYAAELVEHFADLAVERLKAVSEQHPLTSNA